MVGFKILPITPSTGATILLPVGRIAIPSPTIFQRKQHLVHLRCSQSHQKVVHKFSTSTALFSFEPNNLSNKPILISYLLKMADILT